MTLPHESDLVKNINRISLLASNPVSSFVILTLSIVIATLATVKVAESSRVRKLALATCR